jgi:small subunit ribosomal protein S17
MEKVIKKGGKVLEGTIVSTKMDKTVVVSVDRFVKVPKYGKYVVSSKRYKAHEDTGKYKVGDRVKIQETRPISKDKHFIVVKD